MRRLLIGLAVFTIAGLASSWALADDQLIAQKIVKQLRDRQHAGELCGFGISLEVDHGSVWMKGHVASKEQQELALDVARRVEGVQQVVNDLSIKAAKPASSAAKERATPENSAKADTARPALLKGFSSLAKRDPAPVEAAEAPRESKQPSAVNSEELAKTVIEKLRAQKAAGNLRHFDFRVEVERGVVSLNGYVASTQQRQLALDTARQVPGVSRVVSQLEVRSAAEAKESVAADSAPAMDVKLVSHAASKTAQSEKNVGQTNTLKGQENRAFSETLQRGRALDEARLTAFPGDGSTDAAALSLNSPSTAASQALVPSQHPELLAVRTDQQVAQDILQKLEQRKQQGGLRNFQMDVRVLSGEVWMSGEVGSVQHQLEALDVARRAPGVVRVVNDLKVRGAGLVAGPELASAEAPSAPQGFAAPGQTPVPFAPARTITSTQTATDMAGGQPAPPVPAYYPVGAGMGPVRYDQPTLPGYSWPSYAAYPNYAAVTYPQQYSPTAWPYIGPFYPYPQVPLGWRKVTLEWDDGWWMLDFQARKSGR